MDTKSAQSGKIVDSIGSYQLRLRRLETGKDERMVSKDYKLYHSSDTGWWVLLLDGQPIFSDPSYRKVRAAMRSEIKLDKEEEKEDKRLREAGQ